MAGNRRLRGGRSNSGVPLPGLLLPASGHQRGDRVPDRRDLQGDQGSRLSVGRLRRSPFCGQPKHDPGELPRAQELTPRSLALPSSQLLPSEDIFVKI
jgi:hypothetical protein